MTVHLTTKKFGTLPDPLFYFCEGFGKHWLWKVTVAGHAWSNANSRRMINSRRMPRLRQNLSLPPLGTSQFEWFTVLLKQVEVEIRSTMPTMKRIYISGCLYKSGNIHRYSSRPDYYFGCAHHMEQWEGGHVCHLTLVELARKADGTYRQLLYYYCKSSTSFSWLKRDKCLHGHISPWQKSSQRKYKCRMTFLDS